MSSASMASGSHDERRLHQAVIPVIAAFLMSTGIGAPVQPLDDDDVSIDGVSCSAFVGHLLERHDLAAAPPAVGGDEHLAFANR